MINFIKHYRIRPSLYFTTLFASLTIISFLLLKLPDLAQSYHEFDTDHDHSTIKTNNEFINSMKNIMSRSYKINLALAVLAFIWLTYESIILYRQIVRNKIELKAHSKTTISLAIESLEKQRLRAQVMRYFKNHPMGS